MAIGITLVVLVLAWYGLEFLRHRTRAMPGGIDEGRTLPHENNAQSSTNALLQLAGATDRTGKRRLRGPQERIG